MRTEIQTAERIKQEFGSLKAKGGRGGGLAGKKKRGGGKKAKSGAASSRTRDKIEIPEMSLVFSKKFLRNVIEARISEIFSEIQKSLKKISGGEPLPSGIVLTGGGSKLPGIVEFAKQKLKLPCRLGSLAEMPAIEDPQFSTCAGLLLSGFDAEGPGRREERVKIRGEGVGGKLKRLFKIFLP